MEPNQSNRALLYLTALLACLAALWGAFERMSTVNALIAGLDARIQNIEQDQDRAISQLVDCLGCSREEEPQ